METNLQRIAVIVNGLVAGDYLYFDEALTGDIGLMQVYALWAIAISPSGDVYVMDAADQWHQVEESDSIVPQLLAKVEEIEKRYKANSNESTLGKIVRFFFD